MVVARVAFRWVVVGTAALALVTACGPSFQVIYEGNARFEHCYALEENPQASMPAKAQCWRDWSERYTFGQTRDRINYATVRYVALSEAHNAPTDEALMMAAPGETPRTSTITAPAPTNAFEPPPKILEDAGVPASSPAHPVSTGSPNINANIPMLPLDAGAAAANTELPPPLPQASCTDNCGTSFRNCNVNCSADAGMAACKACTTAYRSCMRACFR
jgi:hypothetical protein